MSPAPLVISKLWLYFRWIHDGLENRKGNFFLVPFTGGFLRSF
nr:MAG TPA: hypothetical protein [Bacteriophage sp.]